MWFGDERGYNATCAKIVTTYRLLWFGDERGYNATLGEEQGTTALLWFGDERGYNATEKGCTLKQHSCGLVMKEDITQQRRGQHRGMKVVVW